MKKVLVFALLITLFLALQACATGINTTGTETLSDVSLSENSHDSVPAGEIDLEGMDGSSEEVPYQNNHGQNSAIYVQALTNSLNIRTKPSLRGTVTGSINKNDRVMYLGEENGWYKTYYKNSISYISASASNTKLVTMEKGSATVEKVIETGARCLGAPYLYGAVRLHGGNGVFLKNFTDRAFDCSSFTQYMFYYGASVNLDVTTRTQVKQGTKVTTLQRGDLMFFTNSSRYYNKGNERIGHVAVYLGDNYILHTASDYAVIETITELRRSYFIEARRVV